MNKFKNAIELLEKEVEGLKWEIEHHSHSEEHIIETKEKIRELEFAILTLQASYDLLNLGSINAIDRLRK